MQSKHVTLVGDHSHVEFREVLRWLEEHCRVRRVASIAAASDWLRAARASPDVIVFAQSRPGRLDSADIERIHRVAPLARLVALLGSWCEGETCSGRPWPGVLRIYWHEFVAKMGPALSPGAVELPVWALPRTSTDAERLELSCRPVPRTHRGVVAISAARLVVYEGLADVCSQVGFAAAWLVPGRECRLTNPIAGIWDDTSTKAAERVDLGDFVERIKPAPVLALLNFPRRSDVGSAAATGAASSLGKPFLIDNLLAELGRLTRADWTSTSATSAA